MAVWSEVQYSTLTDDRRIDAEYYRPECLSQDEAIKSVSHKSLGDIAYISDGNHISIADQFCEEGVRYLRGKDLSSFFVSDNDPIYVPESTYKTLKRSHILEGDILLGIVATIGTVGLVTDRFGKLTGNCKLAIVRPVEIESGYLGAFFLSNLGQRELHRRARGTVQQGVILPDLKGISIPILPKSTRRLISQKVKQAYAAKKESEDKYTEAEALLESALGLEKLDLSQKLFYERPFSEVETAGRIDAEYYQPPKRQILDALKSISTKKVQNEFSPVFEAWKPGDDGSVDKVRNYDLTDALQPFLDETVEPVWPSEIKSTKKTLKPGDLVVSRLRSYLKEIAVVLDSGDTMLVGSTEFIVLRPRNGAISPEALMVYLRSKYVQTVLKWCQNGSNHPRFHEDEILNLLIPDVVYQHEEEITRKVKSAISARQESRKLLEEAKRMVEEEILGSAE